jgi:biopolymer transport protein ExbD
MRGAPQSKASGAVSISMTPMIDIVFNLVIFFMLISQFQELAVQEVILRPDARMPYQAVAAVMLAAGRAEIRDWWIAAEMDDRRGASDAGDRP